MTKLFAALALGLTVALAAPADAAEKTYPVSAADVINPERGFWRFAADDFAAVDPGDLAALRAARLTMGYAIVRLDAYRAKPLPAAFLTKLETAFARTRQAGVKVMLRFAYNYPANEFEYENAKDAPLARVLQHIDQLKPVLAENADVIAVMQAGFIGAWGEGHTSSNGLDAPANKIRVRDALLAALPAGRSLQWRYPPDVMAWYPTPPAEGALSRLGFHNDCFLASDTDVGTYDEDPAIRGRQRSYAAARSRAALYGGETCGASPGQERTACRYILAEGRRFHLTTLNGDYFEKFIDAWRAEGCLETVRRSMGHRLALVRAVAPATARRGETARVAVRVRNDGWARLYNPRPFLLTAVHRASGQRTVIAASGDIRSVEPKLSGGVAFDFFWDVAPDAPAGLYDLDLSLPDAAPTIARDPRYAVRFANGSGDGFGWNGETGRYRSGLTVRVE